MEIAYRTLVLKYDLWQLLSDAEKVSALLKVQEEFRRWAREWALSGGSLPPPRNNPLKYFAKRFPYGKSWLESLERNGIKVKKIRTPLFFDAQLRLDKEKDVSRGVFIDLPRREIRIRKWGGGTLTLPLAEKAAEWILARVREGGRLVLAAVWVGPSKRNRAVKLYVALIFRREVVTMRTRRLLVVDLNAFHNGLSWAIVEERRIVTKGILRPDTSKILHLQKTVARLDSLCAKRDEACDEASAAKSRVWRLLRVWEDEAAKKLIRLALQYKAAIVADMPEDNSIRKLKEGAYVPERKIFLNFGRLRQRLRGLAEWYGVPYREERLYSTLCPRCGGKMEELPNRCVRCACGFEAHRDEVPFRWAVQMFPKLISFSSSPCRCGLWQIPRGPRLSTCRARRRLLCGRMGRQAGSSSAEFIKAGSRRRRHEEAVHGVRCDSDASSRRLAGSASCICSLPISVDVRVVFDALLLCSNSFDSYLCGINMTPFFWRHLNKSIGGSPLRVCCLPPPPPPRRCKHADRDFLTGIIIPVGKSL